LPAKQAATAIATLLKILAGALRGFDLRMTIRSLAAAMPSDLAARRLAVKSMN
jgi:hypothetical protein